jgi:hypothetical protein
MFQQRFLCRMGTGLRGLQASGCAPSAHIDQPFRSVGQGSVAFLPCPVPFWMLEHGETPPSELYEVELAWRRSLLPPHGHSNRILYGEPKTGQRQPDPGVVLSARRICSKEVGRQPMSHGVPVNVYHSGQSIQSRGDSLDTLFGPMIGSRVLSNESTSAPLLSRRYQRVLVRLP